jgi:hypothetical protein
MPGAAHLPHHWQVCHVDPRHVLFVPHHFERVRDVAAAKLREARPGWERAQEQMRSRLPEATWSALLNLLRELTRLADTA